MKMLSIEDIKMNRQRMEYKNNKLFHNAVDTKHSVVEDKKYPGMFRIRFPDGKLSDMANFTRTRYKLKGYLANELEYGLEGLGSSVVSLN